MAHAAVASRAAKENQGFRHLSDSQQMKIKIYALNIMRIREAKDELLQWHLPHRLSAVNYHLFHLLLSLIVQGEH